VDDVNGRSRGEKGRIYPCLNKNIAKRDGPAQKREKLLTSFATRAVWQKSRRKKEKLGIAEEFSRYSCRKGKVGVAPTRVRGEGRKKTKKVEKVTETQEEHSG